MLSEILKKSKKGLLSFEKYAKDAQPDVLVTLIQSFVEAYLYR